MNTKNNARTVSTIAKIQNTLLDLLATHSLDDISVTILCKKSGINRTTFYAHYLGLPDLLESIEDRMTQELLHKIMQSSGTQIIGHDQYFLPYLEYVYSNKTFFEIYFKNTAIFGYKKELRDILRTSLTHYINNKTTQKDNVDMLLEYYSAGIHAIIRKWVLDGLNNTPAEIADLIRACTQNNFLN